jgi:hypothetical protein
VKRVHLLAMLVLFLAGVRSGPTLAQGLSPQENWVLQQAAAGRVADLRERFGPEEAARLLKAEFVEALLTGTLPGFKAHRTGIFISHAVISGPLDLTYAVVTPAVFFTACRFLGPVNGSGAHFQKTLSCKDSVFDQGLNFYKAKIQLDAFLGGATLGGAVDFGGAVVEGQFTLAGARLAEPTQEANFNGLKVGQSLSVKDAVFQGGADFTGTVIGGEMNAARSKWESQTQKVIFTGLKAAQSVSFLNAAFNGPEDFSGMEVGGELILDGASFTHPSQPVSLSNLKVSQRLSLDGPRFAGPVDFNLGIVGGLVIVNKARFDHEEQPVKFFGFKAEQHAFFSGCQFAGGLSLLGAHFKHLMLSGDEHHPIRYPLVNLDGVVVEYSLAVGEVIIDEWQAARLQVKGPMIFKKVMVLNRADLRDGSCNSLKLLDTDWPEKPDATWLEGFAYQSISAGEGPEDWRRLISWLGHARLDLRSYTQLAAFFQNGGYQDRGDEVYIQGKRRETLEQWWRPDRLAILVFWDFLAGYGRKPSRTLWVSLLIVMLGTLFFDHRKFDPSFLGGWNWLLDGSPAKAAVVRFFLSLDEFLPGVDLGLAKLWQLNQISFPTLLYYHFHKISGWILIPVALAAAYTQFK